jgi:uncharacterized protein (TIGR03067 family)
MPSTARAGGWCNDSFPTGIPPAYNLARAGSRAVRGADPFISEGISMKTMAAFALGLGLVACGWAAEPEKKDEAPKLEGKFMLTGGKRDGKEIGDESKKGQYTITKDKITIKGMDASFVMSYKLDAKTTPVGIDMEILEGVEGTKGAKAEGIVELKGEVLKLAYSIEKGKRPKNFDGKEGFMFEFKKAK